MENNKRVILAKAGDWDMWIATVRIRASNLRVWNLVTPDAEEKPQRLVEPERPSTTAIHTARAGGNVEAVKSAMEIYNLDKEVYKIDLADFERQAKALSDLTTFLQDTISAHNITYLKNIEPHPWDILRALKKRLAPSDTTQKYEVIYAYRKMCKEVKGNCPMEDFLVAVESKDPHFTSTYMMKLEDGEINDIYTLAEQFRHRLRLKAIYQPNKSTTHTAFAAKATNTATASKLDTSKSDASKSEASKSKASYKDNKKDKPDCLCGRKHFYSECYYFNKTIRPSSWSSNAETQARVDEAMKEPKAKKFVEISLQCTQDFQAKKSNNNDNNKAREAHPSFSAAVSHGSYSTGTKTSIYDLWILDSGLAKPGDTVASGTQVLPIHSYGTIIVSAKGLNGNITIELLDVVYVPEYLTNLVSMHQFAAKGMYHDARNSRLERDHITLCHIKEHGGHYLLEDNTTTSATTQSPTTQGTMKQSSSHAIIKTATPNQWHQVMAHASAEAISHLETSAEGVKIKDKEFMVLKTNECEPCALSKAYQIISKSSIKSDMSIKPFERITFDLMEFQPAYNRYKQVSHIACDFTDFNMVWTHTSKSDSRRILLDAVTNIKVRFNAQVIFIRTDNEMSLDMEFQAELSAQGITFETSAPDTPAQNGHSERKGGILSTKARTMRVAAGLPIYLWPEIMCAADYIANCTPMQKHRWKIPYELVTGKKPNLQHLKAYGCKAYSLDKEIGQKHKTWKLTERAHIGHLVGYDSTNIFRIWIPSQRKIIRTRDVTFNETAFYQPGEPDLHQLI
ncbi:Ribonuclease H-like domain [Lasallia pustulata]|uniref:Ribonuclease H-like domain n=1 Tax=Lasallia pustulata TaxID=136370 RepID=A0A1W5D176_9LECA|nr:Ribonuclease H-like domain [Lasallia pustulata]